MNFWPIAICLGTASQTHRAAAVTLPAIIIYTVFLYRVFWGRAQALSYGPGN